MVGLALVLFGYVSTLRRRRRRTNTVAIRGDEGYTTLNRTYGRTGMPSSSSAYNHGSTGRYEHDLPQSPPEEISLPPYPLPPPYPGKDEDVVQNGMAAHMSRNNGYDPPPGPPPPAHVHDNVSSEHNICLLSAWVLNNP